MLVCLSVFVCYTAVLKHGTPLLFRTSGGHIWEFLTLLYFYRS